MTRDEFKRQLDQVREVIHRGLAYYAVWKALKLHDKDSAGWSLEEQNGVLSRFRGFFAPVALALLDMALLEFAKLFDKDPRTARLTNLLRVAEKEPSLAPYKSAGDLQAISVQIKQSKAVLVTLKRTRDQRLAHMDANPVQVDPLLTKDFDKLVEFVTSAFNTLSVGHDQNVFSWEFSLKETDRHTAEVLGILIEEQRRRRQRHEEEMVRIGLDHLHRERVPKAFVRDAIRTLGLSEEQMQRVEKQYAAESAEGSSE